MPAFEDIRIVDFDDQKSTKRDDQYRGLFHMHLVLSQAPPPGWADFFAHEWQEHLYSKKQKAYVIDKNLVVLSTAEDLQTVHIPELKAVVAATNRRYATFHKQQLQSEQNQKDAADKDEQALRDLKNRLKFD